MLKLIYNYVLNQFLLSRHRIAAFFAMPYITNKLDIAFHLLNFSTFNQVDWMKRFLFSDASRLYKYMTSAPREKSFFFNTTFNNNFLFWVLFAAISPGIIAFTLYTKVQKFVGASLAGFTLYIFSIYSAIYGIILFGEALLSFHYYGAALVFTGVYLARKIVK